MNVRLWLHYLRHEPQFNRALVYYCRVFTLQHKTTWGNCCHYLNNIELNCMGTSQCHHCAPLLNVSVLLLFIEVCGHLFIHSSMKVPSQPFRRTGVFEVWTLTGPLQHLDSFLFQQSCCARDHYSIPIWAKLTNRFTFFSPTVAKVHMRYLSWYACCLWFSPNVLLYVVTKHFHFDLICSHSTLQT